MFETAATETKMKFGQRLAQMIEAALGGEAFPNPEGWRFEGFKLRAMRGGNNNVENEISPVLRFELPDRALDIAVMTREPEKPAYFRSAHYDIAYSVESVEDSQKLYELDRATIDAFCQWVVSWDGPDEPPPDAAAT